MGGITKDQVEWATVDRMRSMLSSVRRDYEITQTYTLFTGILCWTLQRIRSKPENPRAAARLSDLRSALEVKHFDQFFRLSSPRPVLVKEGEDFRRTPVPEFNDFSAFEHSGKPFTALNVLVALRNAVAHGDARRVLPVNHNARLLGYELICVENQGKTNQIIMPVRLNRTGMFKIADTLAECFCDAMIEPGDVGSASEARHISEAR